MTKPTTAETRALARAIADACPRLGGHLELGAFDLAVLLHASTFDAVTVNGIAVALGGEEQLRDFRQKAGRHARKLVAAGLLSSTRDRFDHRSLVLTLTAKGKRLLLSSRIPPDLSRG